MDGYLSEIVGCVEKMAVREWDDGRAVEYNVLNHLAREWLKNGRKTMVLTEQMRESFSETVMTFPVKDYEQPYDDVLIVYPVPQERAKLWTVYSLLKMGYVEEGRCIVIVNVFSDRSRSTRRIPAWCDEDLELLSQDDFYRDANRIALNAMMVASCCYRTHLILAEADGSWPRHKRREWEARQPQMIEYIEQNIKWHDEELSAEEWKGGSHSRPKSHWRKGYWRRQRFGYEFSECRRVFIRRVLVNAPFFSGGPGDSTVTYVGA